MFVLQSVADKWLPCPHRLLIGYAWTDFNGTHSRLEFDKRVIFGIMFRVLLLGG